MVQIRLMIVGAQKAGTSSLLQYLAQHPKVCTHQKNETGYFVRDDVYSKGYDEGFLKSLQSPEDNGAVIFAKSIMMDIPKALARLKAHNPDVYLVALLRHPVERAYSSYWYARRMGWESSETFESAIQVDTVRFATDIVRRQNCAYLDRSVYIKHLRSMQEYFDISHIKVFLLEDLKYDAIAVCKTLYSLFDELSPDFVPHVDRQHNEAAMPRFKKLAQWRWSRSSLPKLKRAVRQLLPMQIVSDMKHWFDQFNERDFMPPPINPETYKRLVEYFKPYNQQLSEFLGRELSHWDRVDKN